ncbi:hypothetical protein MKK63_20415 [Methylobacterium sp. J-088]|uniref:hypothetical protein n=1 Tax=Methylobacterium sp. J-088 TaxID=2836664 RepID=UPI001FB94D41|nr:hypothetical protein [Methylobacterium sp. J-088]MCJ2065056.1 hypothetical protein [Methylobacterium sp. J-088]
MRLILLLLARANVQWALAEMARSDRLRREAQDALDAAERRMNEAGCLAARVRALH